MKAKRIIGVVIIILSLATLYIFTNKKNVSAAVISEYTGFAYNAEAEVSGSYLDYIKDENNIYQGDDIVYEASENYNYDGELNDIYKTTCDNVDGLYIPETGNITWTINVLEAGYYNIRINYYAISGRSSEITRGLKINGVYPFSEAQNFSLPRIWKDEYNVATKRVEGKHDTKPSQIEKLRWNETSIRDKAGYYDGEAYLFYFNAGQNTITFLEDKEPVVINSIILYHEEEIKSYNEVSQIYKKNNYEVISNTELIEVQGEASYEKSSPILAPVANWSSYKVDPYVKYKTIYNTIGGTTWRVSGDWISWNLEVPVDGLYEITLKVLQNYNRGMYSTRRLYLNGEIPFEECKNITFKYSSDWQNVTLGDENGSYLFYLKAGQENIITLEASIGIYSDVARTTKSVITKLNTLYRNVVMITSIAPEKYQNYFLEERIDGLFETIDQCINDLQSCVDRIVEIAGSRSSLISSFDRTLYQLKQFRKSETNIQVGLSELDDNISSLGTLVMTISEQSLAIDKIIVHSDKAKLPKATTNFFQKIWHEITMLIGSYGVNTSLESSVEVEGPTITVWIMSGRDQSQLLRQLIDESFTLQHGINVKLKLVTSTVLLPATLTKNGPDVAIGVAQNIPVNWGIRNAVVDLKKEFGTDFDNFANSFHESSIVPFTFNGGVYALPDTQDFLVSFIRTDIVNEIGITLPKTWDEVENTLPILQRRYLDYYLPNTKGALSTLLYAMIAQNGGKLYNPTGSEVTLLEKKAEEAFIDFATFFSDKGFAISANFSNRFRTGEMPLGVYNFSLYNTLSVFAPDIKGQWEFAELPGYEDNEGNIINYSTSTVTGTVILNDSDEKQASWEFMKWWLGEEAQVNYARGMEAILGAAARYPTANLEAFAQLPWSAKEYRTLTAQREKAVGVPTVPGDYIVGRYIDNAFRSVVNDNVNPRDSLYDYTKKINKELTRKREEFGLN